MAMYADWSSVQTEIQTEAGHKSVLSLFPSTVGREVASAIVHSLAQSVGRANDNKEPSSLTTDADVRWTMQILCYGLSLPLTDNDTIRDCVSIYCDWLSCLLTEPKCSVPLPVLEAPNEYVPALLNHLYNVFIPRLDGSLDLVNRQAVHCHRVLRAVQSVAEKSTTINSRTWDALLRFLLAVNDILLAPPTEKDSIGSVLCERVLNVLFDVWILSCAHCFPAPCLWKTLQDMCSSWRHHDALVAQWHRVNVTFTTRLLRNIYHTVPRLPAAPVDDDVAAAMDAMDRDLIVQCWFRFLHVLSNPVDLSRPHVIANTHQFLQASLTSSDVPPLHQIECLHQLPVIFYRAMTCIATIVDAFLGVIHKDVSDPDTYSARPLEQAPASVTPLPARKPRTSLFGPSKAKDAATRASVSDIVISTTNSVMTHFDMAVTSLSPCRPTVNSLLHLLGSWLLEASLVGVHVHGHDSKAPLLRGRTASLHIVDADPLRLQSHVQRSLTDAATAGAFGVDSYEAGRAQACGALCRIFSSHKTGEQVLPIYMSRFYISLYYALKDTNGSGIPAVLASVIINSSDLLRVDLIGVHVILPQLLSALEDLQQKFRYKTDGGADEDAELRRSSIHLLLSMLCLPLQYGQTPIKAVLDDSQSKHSVTFISLKPRMTELLLQFLRAETDAVNTQMLLGGLVLSIMDQALWETATRDQLPATDQPQESSVALFNEAVKLICKRLMESWKNDLSCALATLEVLAALARVRLVEQSEAECKRAIRLICDFVISQCSRPAPSHSRDLHSVIVAAFQCLTVWLIEHDYLMCDNDCLQTVLQVIELGISGSRSQAKPTESPCLKGDKELRPVSMRVREAAEALLTAVLDYIGCFPPPCGSESLCTLLDEESMMKLCHSTTNDPSHDELQLQYYIIDGTTIVGLLEKPVAPDHDGEALPVVMAIVRGAFGRHAWIMQLRHQSCSHKTHSVASCEKDRTSSSSSITEQKAAAAVQAQYFPDAVDHIAPVLADKSIPQLDATMTDYQTEINELSSLVTSQIEFEQASHESRAKNAPHASPCTEPSVCSDYKTARLMLSHYGFLNLEGLKVGSMAGMPQSLARLRVEDMQELYRDLRQLDGLPVRTADTVSLFYVKHGQTVLTDMLANVCQKQNVQPQFLEFVRSLGWPVDVLEHSGWTGSVATSWKTQSDSSEEKAYLGDTGGALYDGQQQVLYWADVSTELAFIVPSPTSHALAAVDKALPHTVSTDASLGSSLTADALSHSMSGRHKSMSLDLDNLSQTTDLTTLAAADVAASRVRRSTRSSSTLLGTDVQVVVAWLESFEDYLTFPVADLTKNTAENRLPSATSGAGQRSSVTSPICVIFIHPLQNGLCRVKLQAHQSRIGDAVPLVDGMVVSRRVLGHLVRQTAVNIFKRRQLDSDLYQPPHVRRKLKIKEIVEKYQCRLTEPELYTSLFSKTF